MAAQGDDVLLVKCQLGPNTQLDCLFDTGSEVNVIRQSVVPVSARWLSGTQHHLRTATGDRIRTLGRVRLDVAWPGGPKREAEFVVVSNTLLHPAILGWPWLRAQGLTLDLPGKISGCGSTQVHRTGGSRATGTGVASIAATPTFLTQTLQGIKQEDMRNLVIEHAACFASDDGQYGLAKVKPMRVKLLDPNCRPIRRPAYNMGPVDSDELNGVVEELVAAGVASRAGDDVEWSFPCRLVPKPGDATKKRFVVDLHQLTDLIRVGAYPAPNMDALLLKLGGKQFFAKLDFQSSFYQFLVAEDCRHLLGFVTPSGGHYVLNRVPMGLAISSGFLQKRLDEIFAGIGDVHGYADDWFIASTTWEQHMRTVKAVLERVERYGLLLKPSKCVFGVQRVSLLGRIVSPAGIQPDPANIEDIFKMRKPTSCDDVRVFLGRTQWTAKFVDNFAAITQPLRPLLKKGATFKWDKACEHAWKRLQVLLTSAPILAHPSWSHPFVLEIDASRAGLGAVLLQDGKPVAYKSRALRPAETNLPITFLELQTLVWIVEEWRHFLRRPFIVRTDHKSLTWLRNLRRPMGRLAEWAAVLLDFDFSVQYTPGTAMGLADALSRMVAATTLQEHISETDTWLAKQQTFDAECTRIVRALGQESEATPGDRLSEKFLLNEDGLLCRVGSRYNLPTLLPVVPRACRLRILQQEHDEAAHPGQSRTLSRLRDRYFWPELENDARAYVETCEGCQRGKTTRRPRIPLGTLVASKPNELVACDLLSGFWPAATGEVAVLVMVDHFSKAAEAVALRDKTSSTVARAFEQTWTAKYGAPTAVLTDQGPEFTGAPFMDICRKLNIKKKFTTTYHPQGDGQTERMNRTIIGRLTATISSQAQWPQLLGRICKAYNEEKHATTGYTPLLLGDGPLPKHRFDASPAKISRARKEARQHTRRHAVERAGAAAEKVKDLLQREKCAYLKAGAQVLVRNLEQPSATAGKLQPRWLGPYRVIDRPHLHTALVTPCSGGNARTVNIQNVKPYLVRTPPSKTAPSPGRSATIHDMAAGNNLQTRVSKKYAPATTWTNLVTRPSETPGESPPALPRASGDLQDVTNDGEHQTDAARLEGASVERTEAGGGDARACAQNAPLAPQPEQADLPGPVQSTEQPLTTTDDMTQAGAPAREATEPGRAQGKVQVHVHAQARGAGESEQRGTLRELRAPRAERLDYAKLHRVGVERK